MRALVFQPSFLRLLWLLLFFIAFGKVRAQEKVLARLSHSSVVAQIYGSEGSRAILVSDMQKALHLYQKFSGHSLPSPLLSSHIVYKDVLTQLIQKIILEEEVRFLGIFRFVEDALALSSREELIGFYTQWIRLRALRLGLNSPSTESFLNGILKGTEVLWDDIWPYAIEHYKAYVISRYENYYLARLEKYEKEQGILQTVDPQLRMSSQIVQISLGEDGVLIEEAHYPNFDKKDTQINEEEFKNNLIQLFMKTLKYQILKEDISANKKISEETKAQLEKFEKDIRNLCPSFEPFSQAHRKKELLEKVFNHMRAFHPPQKKSKDEDKEVFKAQQKAWVQNIKQQCDSPQVLAEMWMKEIPLKDKRAFIESLEFESFCKNFQKNEELQFSFLIYHELIKVIRSLGALQLFKEEGWFEEFDKKCKEEQYLTRRILRESNPISEGQALEVSENLILGAQSVCELSRREEQGGGAFMKAFFHDAFEARAVEENKQNRYSRSEGTEDLFIYGFDGVLDWRTRDGFEKSWQEKMDGLKICEVSPVFSFGEKNSQVILQIVDKSSIPISKRLREEGVKEALKVAKQKWVQKKAQQRVEQILDYSILGSEKKSSPLLLNAPTRKYHVGFPASKPDIPLP